MILPKSAIAAKVSPDKLLFSTHQGEALKLELDVQDVNSTEEVFVETIGFKSDYKIVKKENSILIELAPSTIQPGSIHGEVSLKISGSTAIPIRVSGEILPWLKVNPQRVFLGPISHLPQVPSVINRQIDISAEQDFDITSIEGANDNVVSWTLSPPPGTLLKKRTIHLEIKPHLLARGAPYGALAVKTIVINTTHSKVSSITMAISGMLSVNSSGRDYTRYLYKAQTRWQGIWLTPNIAAVFLSVCLIIVCAIGCQMLQVYSGNKRQQYVAFSVTLIAIVVGSYYLAHTYSRSGWLGAWAGTMLLVLFNKQHRRYSFVYAAAIVLTVITTQDSLSRLASTTRIQGDKSIYNRTLVWEGALRMISDYPRGVGVNQFGKVFKAKYQKPSHTETYSTAINDFLTFSAELGWITTVIFISLIMTFAVMFLDIGKEKRAPILVGCGAAICSYIVCGLFSTLTETRINISKEIIKQPPILLLLCLFIGICVGAKWILQRRAIARFITIYIITTVLVATVSGSAVYYASAKCPKVRSINISGIEGLRVTPGIGIKSHLIYICDVGEKPSQLLANTLIPLAEKGYTVSCFETNKNMWDAFLQLSNVCKLMDAEGAIGAEWSLAGHRRGGQLALAIANQSRAEKVACYLTSETSAFPEFALSSYGDSLRLPLLFLEEKCDSEFPQQIRQSITSGPNFCRKANSGYATSFEPKWERWIEEIDSFID